jgi:type I restriction enzyme M protein
MRKSLGEKRRELSPEQIEEVTKLHGAFAERELVKIVDNESFGYRTITVDRPLRAYWHVSGETWEGIEHDKPVAKFTEAEREALPGALKTLEGSRWEDEAACRAAVKDAMSDRLVKPSAPLVKALAARCMVRDPDAPEQRDSKDRIVWDMGLRDTENVPLGEDVEEYLAREVLPHVPDAHVEDREGRIGYEIPFTRLFYKYTPPRPSEEIKAELREREKRIRELLEEVLV